MTAAAKHGLYKGNLLLYARWVGVTVRHARYEAWVTHMKQKCTIARFQTKEQAARVHDEACIYQVDSTMRKSDHCFEIWFSLL